MSKLIAVWGSPNSGKSTFATKLALSIYSTYQATVVVVYTDCETPMLPVIFPSYKSDDLYSLGDVLSKVDISSDEVVNGIVTVKSKVNLGFMGFKDGENKYTYPEFSKDKVEMLLETLKTLADFVIVDCTSSIDNLITNTAVLMADEVIRLSSPDLKSLSFLFSQAPLWNELNPQKHIQGINVPNEDLFMPIDDVKSHLSDVRFTVPYSKEVKRQMLDGKLYDNVSDKKFLDKMSTISNHLV